MTLTAERARELWSYDPETGILRRKSDGEPVGIQHKLQAGTITIDGERHFTARVIWLIVKGVWPSSILDHKDRDPSNNRWTNLRLAGFSGNSRNRSKNDRAQHPYKGIRAEHNRWWARIRLNGKRINVGSFATAEEAARAYDKLAREHFGEFACTNEDLGLLPKLEEAA